MVRLNFNLTPQQIAALKAQATRTGLTVSELIRRAVDAFLAKQKG